MRIVAAIVFFSVWQLLGTILPRVIFASPGRTADALVTLTTSGELWAVWAESLGIMVVALVFASTSGIFLGLLFGRFRSVDRLFEPVTTALFMTPRVALLPLIALWLGYQDPAKIVLIFLFSFFEIFFTVRNGVRTIDAEFVEVARSYCIPEQVMLRKVILPAAIPYVITGLRLGLLHGMVGVVVAGFLLENNGIGGFIFNAGGSFHIPQLFASLLTVAAVGIAISVGIRMLERAVTPWKVEAA
ncbi:MAG TPA: ABC transporter permease [Candidatus Limnocylindrales bacterium]|nr:ABC transporter permease [Candidatus Limnocylindrales bacterium]